MTPVFASTFLMRWLPILAAFAIGLAAFNMWQSRRGPVIGSVPTKIVFNNIDVSGKAASLYEGIKTSVAGIKDEATATASLPKLREHAAALGDMRELAEKMPADSRKGLAGIFSALVPGLEGLVLTAIKAPGAEAVVKPVLEQIIDRMKGLSKG